MTRNDIGDAAIVILAAGMGTRMKSDKAKVLHELCGKPMIYFVVKAACESVGENVITVVGHQAERVRNQVCQYHPDVIFALQDQQLGTGHAALCAMRHVPSSVDHVVILCGDTPLIKSETIRKLLEDHRSSGRNLSVLAVELDEPTGYGRLLLDDENGVTGIVEEADASPEQKRIKVVNSGIYCVDSAFLSDALQQIDTDNAQGEYYLTDIMEIGFKSRKRVGAFLWRDSVEVIGVNTIADLEKADTLMRDRSGKTA